MSLVIDASPFNTVPGLVSLPGSAHYHPVKRALVMCFPPLGSVREASSSHRTTMCFVILPNQIAYQSGLSVVSLPNKQSRSLYFVGILEFESVWFLQLPDLSPSNVTSWSLCRRFFGPNTDPASARDLPSSSPTAVAPSAGYSQRNSWIPGSFTPATYEALC